MGGARAAEHKSDQSRERFHEICTGVVKVPDLSKIREEYSVTEGPDMTSTLSHFVGLKHNGFMGQKHNEFNSILVARYVVTLGSTKY